MKLVKMCIDTCLIVVACIFLMCVLLRLQSAGFYPVILSPFVGSVVLSIPEPTQLVREQSACSRGSCYLGLVFHSLCIFSKLDWFLFKIIYL